MSATTARISAEAPRARARSGNRPALFAAPTTCSSRSTVRVASATARRTSTTSPATVTMRAPPARGVEGLGGGPGARRAGLVGVDGGSQLVPVVVDAAEREAGEILHLARRLVGRRRRQQRPVGGGRAGDVAATQRNGGDEVA